MRLFHGFIINGRFYLFKFHGFLSCHEIRTMISNRPVKEACEPPNFVDQRHQVLNIRVSLFPEPI